MSASPRLSAGVRRRLTIFLAVIGGLLVLLGVGAPLAAAEPAYDVEPPEVQLAPGGRLVCNIGSWQGGGITFSYTWLRDGSAFATGSLYQLTSADKGHTFTCIVVGRNSEGSEEEESWNAYEDGTGAPKPPVNVTPPEVSGNAKAGEAKVGETLGCGRGTWTGTAPISYAYHWLREGSPIESATEVTYKVKEEDQGFSLACSVTATNSVGSASKQSSNTVKVVGSAPSDVTLPKVEGKGIVGTQLTCKPEQWKGAPPPTFTYRWLRSGSKEPVGSGATYTIEEADRLHKLSCEVTAENAYGKATAKSSNEVEVPGVAPSNTELPKVAGVGEVGSKLTCEPGKWSGVPAPEVIRYQWLLGSESVATGSSYTVPPEDAGRTLSCEVTVKNTLGEAVAASAPLPIKGESHTKSIPENRIPPAVSGEATLGNTLTCSHGEWSEDPPVESYTYRWLREGEEISGATSSKYVATSNDLGLKIVCRVKAKNSIGAALADSAPVQVKGVRPVSKSLPTISGAQAVGETLTCSPGSWEADPKATYSYHWLGVTGSPSGNSYVVQEADRGRQLFCEVTATNFEGSASAKSAAVEIPAIPPRIESGPTLSATPPYVPGTTLTCNAKASGKPAPTVSYVWLTDGGPIEGATSNTYVLTKFDEGHLLACEVIASNAAGSERAVSSRLRIPGSPPEDVEPPFVAGGAQVGEQLTCEPGLWHGKPAPTLKYQWLIDGFEVPGATEETYIPEQEYLGAYISCAVTATNSEGTLEAWSENSPQIVARAVRKLEVLPVPPFEAAPKPPTTAQILAALEKQLLAALKKARRSGLLKHGSYSFSFEPLTGGKLEVLWYQTPKPSKASSKAKPVLLARVRSTFGVVSTQTQKLRLTLAGRRALKQSKRPKLTVEGVFTPAGGKAVTWSKTIVLSG